VRNDGLTLKEFLIFADIWYFSAQNLEENGNIILNHHFCIDATARQYGVATGCNAILCQPM
jgi:hypothetical protein